MGALWNDETTVVVLPFVLDDSGGLGKQAWSFLRQCRDSDADLNPKRKVPIATKYGVVLFFGGGGWMGYSRPGGFTSR